MSRFTEEHPLVFVTGNAGKRAEVEAVLSDVHLVTTAIDLPELQGDSALDISIEKARIAAERIGGPCICEDTSLCFTALNDLPGPYIKWFLKKLGHAGLNNLLAFTTDKSAYAQCIFAYCEGPGHEPIPFVGRCYGKIVPARGSTRFGWDAIFEHEDTGVTFGEMSAEQKNRVSHRSMALRELSKFLCGLP